MKQACALFYAFIMERGGKNKPQPQHGLFLKKRIVKVQLYFLGTNGI